MAPAPEQDAVTQKPFFFFRLPLELRQIVYRNLFLSNRDDRVVTPDPLRTRRNADPHASKEENDDRTYLSYRTLNLKGLAFLQTCKQVHYEGTTVLYGENVFHFSDHPHYKKRGAVTGIERPTALQRHGSSAPTLPSCDFVSMTLFLAGIGWCSRTKLKHVQLEFTDMIFLIDVDDSPRGRDYWVGGKYVGDALEILSKCHSLRSMELLISPPPIYDLLDLQISLIFGRLFPSQLFCRNGYMGHRVAEKLVYITGIKQLKISPNVEPSLAAHKAWCQSIPCRPGAFQQFKAAKQTMETGYSDSAGMTLGLCSRHQWTKPPVDQVAASALPSDIPRKVAVSTGSLQITKDDRLRRREDLDSLKTARERQIARRKQKVVTAIPATGAPLTLFGSLNTSVSGVTSRDNHCVCIDCCQAGHIDSDQKLCRINVARQTELSHNNTQGRLDVHQEEKGEEVDPVDKLTEQMSMKTGICIIM